MVLRGRTLELPHNGWRPRKYQQPMWDAWQKQGVDRLIGICHRRWGKDEICLHGTQIKAMERPANYWHCFPEYAQARKGIWQAVNAHTGRRRIDEAFPHELRSATNDQEMRIEFVNGASWQVIGSDRYNSLVGGGVAGIVFSEWALANPSAWAYFRPMLEENAGWAAFITTPRGRNHAKSMYERAVRTERWFAELSTIRDTRALTKAQLEEAREDYAAIFGADIAETLIEQEYYCNFNAAVVGAFYGREMMEVRAEGRVLAFDALPGVPVHRAWDIGVDDDTAIWWFQVAGGQVRILDCYSASGAGVDHYAEEVNRRIEEYGWANGIDWVPHDAKQRIFGIEGARTTLQQMQSFGLNPHLVPSLSKQDGIQAARKTLGRCVFHPRCEDLGLGALEQYRREFDEEKRAFRPTEVRDWTTHLADAFRYLSLIWRIAPRRTDRQTAPTVPTGVPLDVPDPHTSRRKRV